MPHKVKNTVKHVDVQKGDKEQVKIFKEKQEHNINVNASHAEKGRKD